MHADHESPGAQLQAHRHRLATLLQEGRRLQGDDTDPAGEHVEAWQRNCAALIGQLSGGRKTHWLSRAYSEAFLAPPSRESSAGHGLATEVSVAEILARVMAVLELAVASLARLEESDAPTADTRDGSRRFAFLDDPGLRAGVVQADAEAESALEHGAFALSLVSTCSVLESIITDALERADAPPTVASGALSLHQRPFERRILDAEVAGVISAGCRRLPDIARSYRALLTQDGDVRPDAEVSEREAVRTRQVLRVIVRDLAPGR